MKDFISYMESKNHAPSTQKSYLKYVELFLQWYNQDPINCTKKDILDYLAYLKKHTRQQNISRRSSLTALNHYFMALLQAGLTDKIPPVLSAYEIQTKSTFIKFTHPMNSHSLPIIFTAYLYRALTTAI